MVKIDGIDFSKTIIAVSVKERFEKVYGDSVTMKQNGENSYDVIGTKYNHTVIFTKHPDASQDDINAFFDILSDCKEYHLVTLPHNKSEISYNAHISGGERILADKINGDYIWDDDITVEFQSISPQRRSDD